MTHWRVSLSRLAAPDNAEFMTMALERQKKLAEDLGWFKDQRHVIPGRLAHNP